MTAGAGSGPECWLVVEVPLPDDEESAAALIEELATLGEGGVEEAEGVLRAYLPAPEGAADALLSRVRDALGADRVPRPVEFTHRWQAHEDWSEIWRRGLAPRRVTDRLIVTPSWKHADAEPGDLVITLDPGMAFGTAEHATTRACLRLLDGFVDPGHRVADIGAGSGILSIGAALLGASRVVAVDMDPRAAATAEENCELNGVRSRIEVRTARVDPDFFRGAPAFDGIVANIESGVLVPLLDAFHGALLPRGWLILSGILETEARDVTDRTREAGFRMESEDREGRWWAGAFRPK